jgi:hypothetical protein
VSHFIRLVILMARLSLDVSDPVIRGSTTYVPNAMGTADNSSTAAGGAGSNTDASNVSGNSGEANVSGTNNNDDGGGGGGVATQGNAATGDGTPITETSAVSDAVPPPPAAAGSGPAPQQQQQQQQRRRRTAAPTKHNLLTHPLKAKLRNGTEVPVLSLNPPYKDEGTKWVDTNATTVGTGNDDVNAKPLQTQWYHKTSFNEKVCKENEKFSEMSRIQSFLHMMPPAQLQTMLDLTNTPSPTRTNAPMSSFQACG